MGDHVFHIPSRWEIDVVHIKPGEVRDLCHAVEPVEVMFWAAFVRIKLFVEDASADQPRIQLQVYRETDKDDRSMYEHVRELLALQNLKVSDLPIEKGFRVWRNKDWPKFDYRPYNPHFRAGRNFSLARENLYISDDLDLLSPKGDAAVFACRSYRYKKEDVDFHEDCRTGIWDGHIDFTARGIDTHRVPKEKWKELYRGLLKLRQSLISNTAKTDF
jgi:hypothetical protein